MDQKRDSVFSAGQGHSLRVKRALKDPCGAPGGLERRRKMALSPEVKKWMDDMTGAIKRVRDELVALKAAQAPAVLIKRLEDEIAELKAALQSKEEVPEKEEGDGIFDE